ncbi:hypothetical protein LJC48_01070 [Desulfovibrio sp. OttesenSCG-928-C06]|nr:hypothetical protein [Desulfovibrio sp. OttesenSCG-928-C06]
MKFIFATTDRGFPLIKFRDLADTDCSLQQSSMVGEEAIWLGTHEPEARVPASQVMPGGCGWVRYPLPKEVFISTRMHLTRSQVRELLPLLERFAKHGTLPRITETSSMDPTVKIKLTPMSVEAKSQPVLPGDCG